MNFGFCVGNVPFQKEKASGGSNDAPLYQVFCTLAYTLSSHMSSLLIKAGWFSMGRENLLAGFRAEMLECSQLKCLTVFPDSGDVFDGVEIKGGVCFYLREKGYLGDCEYTLIENGQQKTCMRALDDFNILVRDPFLSGIVKKVQTLAKDWNQPSVASFLSADTPFGISSNVTSSKKKPLLIAYEKNEEFNILLYHIEKQKRKTAYCRDTDITKNRKDIPFYKVLIPIAAGSGNDGKILGYPILALPYSVCSQSFIYIKMNNRVQAENFMSYLNSKFLRAMVSAVKITQACPRRCFTFVPMIDLNRSFKDSSLYERYGMTQEEADYIEKNIKPLLK